MVPAAPAAHAAPGKTPVQAGRAPGRPIAADSSAPAGGGGAPSHDRGSGAPAAADAVDRVLGKVGGGPSTGDDGAVGSAPAALLNGATAPAGSVVDAVDAAARAPLEPILGSVPTVTAGVDSVSSTVTETLPSTTTTLNHLGG
jgi:hypothetical protein